MLRRGLLSFTVELLQFLVVPGRDASLSDLLTNTTSGAIGATLGGILPGMVAPRPRGARGLLAGGIALPLLLLGASGVAARVRRARRATLSRWAHARRAATSSTAACGRAPERRADAARRGAGPTRRPLRRRLAAGSFALGGGVISGAPVP